ncbi:DoxX family protein [Jatrophihabitans sp. DSM 45814]
MRLKKNRADDQLEAAPTTVDDASVVQVRPRRFSNGWPTIPLRIFLSSIFLFGGYAKLTYPDFFNPNASFGFKSAVDSAKASSPISGLLGPLSDHASVYGHITAFAELAIGAGLLVGLLTRVAALGGMALTTLIVLSVNWPEVRQYTGNGGWFTSVDLAVAAGLSVFLLGGAGPLSLDAAYGLMRTRRRAKEAADEQNSARARSDETSADLEDSRRRLRGDETVQPGYPVPGDYSAPPAYSAPPEYSNQPEHSTQQLPNVDTAPTPSTVGRGSGSASYPSAPPASSPPPAGPPTAPAPSNAPPSDPNSLWNQPRSETDGQ